ncbi:hypothetical protein WJX79_002251 [Trebouxia sp. C0005]
MDGKRKLDTNAIVATAMEEEEGRKKQKRGTVSWQQGTAKKGLTLSDVEAAEGGIVKEGLVTAAQHKRALQRKRKGKNAGEDTDMPSHVEEAEEFLDREEDDGVKLEPFNLAQERAEGHFDESGHYVENKKDDAEETDAWLGSDDAAPVSDTVKRQILERQQRMAAAEEAPEMSKPQEAALQRDIAAILLPGESVTKALQRLGKQDKRPAGKRNKDLQPKVELSAEEKQIARQQFEKLTEAASSLMDSGELDIYSQKKEYLERCAALFAPAADIFGHEDDMFAENAENEPQQNGDAAQPANGHLSAAEAEVDYQSWPIKELRRFLTERGLDCAGIIEKRELAEKVKQAASQGPEGQVSTVPVGYAFDPSSGYHYSADTQMYFDSNSGGYYSNSDSKWYLYNEATQQFQEWQQQPS